MNIMENKNKLKFVQPSICEYFKEGKFYQLQQRKKKIMDSSLIVFEISDDDNEKGIDELLKTPVKKRQMQVPIFTDSDASTDTECDQTKNNTLNKENVQTPEKTPTKKLVRESSFDSVSSPTKSSPSKSQNERLTKTVNWYSLKFFTNIFKDVNERGKLKNLLDSTEQRVIAKYLDLERCHQYLCYKLFTFISKWYNFNKMCKKIYLDLEMNASELQKMYEVLRAENFIDTDFGSDEDVDTLLNNMDANQLKDICKKFKILPKGTKLELIDKLVKHSRKQPTLFQTKSSSDVLKAEIKKMHGNSIRLNKSVYEVILKTYLLHTYTNAEYWDTQRYFSDMTYLNTVFPNYKIEDFVPFESPEQFDGFYESWKLKRKFYKAEESRKFEEMKTYCEEGFERLRALSAEGLECEPHLKKFSARGQYESLLSSGIKHLATRYHRDVLIWINYFIETSGVSKNSALWYNQKAHIEMHYLKDYELAAKTILAAFKTQESQKCFSEYDLHELSARFKALKRTTKYKIDESYYEAIGNLAVTPCDSEVLPSLSIKGHSILSGPQGRKRNYAVMDGEDKVILRVEDLALRHYSNDGYPKGIHCEGSFLQVVFCLSFWDLIYGYFVPKTFLSRYQKVPLDMYSQQFYLNRKAEIDKRLLDIQSKWSEEEFLDFLQRNWEEHSHEDSFVKMDSFIKDISMLKEMVTTIDRTVLSKILERFVKDYKTHHSGLPDLFLWNSQAQKSRFVEVKSENDKLSIKQKLWLLYLKDIGADIEVCYVETSGGCRKKRTGRSRESNVTAF